MNKKLVYILGLLVLLLGVGSYAFAKNDIADRVSAVTSAPPAQTEPVTKDAEQLQTEKTNTPALLQINSISPLAVVNSPNSYLNKKVFMTARFDKFATLGLDYKPAMRSSETYISFLIFRPDTDKNIPLPEMKLFVTRKSAEKMIDLKEGDSVKITGTVFSTALGDAWIDVESISKIKTDSAVQK